MATAKRLYSRKLNGSRITPMPSRKELSTPLLPRIVRQAMIRTR